MKDLFKVDITRTKSVSKPTFLGIIGQGSMSGSIISTLHVHNSLQYEIIPSQKQLVSSHFTPELASLSSYQKFMTSFWVLRSVRARL